MDPMDSMETFRRAAAQADRLAGAVRPDQLGDPTPCHDWDVRSLVNHVVTGNLLFASYVTGQPAPDRSVDHVVGDPAGAMRMSLAVLAEAFAMEGMLDRTYPTPWGDGPGTLLVDLRGKELTAHSWDLARATGQAAALDQRLFADVLAAFERMDPFPRGADKPFGPVRPAPDGASAADRLAAFLGREV
jgi:uncharacterized protein (TIGR03086 family)